MSILVHIVTGFIKTFSFKCIMNIEVSRNVSNKNGKSRHSYLIPSFRENTLRFPH